MTNRLTESGIRGFSEDSLQSRIGIVRMVCFRARQDGHPQDGAASPVRLADLLAVTTSTTTGS